MLILENKLRLMIKVFINVIRLNIFGINKWVSIRLFVSLSIWLEL